MLFYEPLFLFLFLPVVCATFLAARNRAPARAGVLLTASITFYLWSEPRFVPIVLATCWLDYQMSKRIAAGSRPRLWLTVGVLINLGLLLTYKYLGFAIRNLDVLLIASSLRPWNVWSVALPVGVSFIVFEKITYLVDIFRGLSRPSPSFTRYLLYVFLFPKLLAGPIIKYHDLETQLNSAGRLDAGDLSEGFRRFMLGVVKKTLLADTLASGADMTFSADILRLGFADAWWGVAFFTFQIYLDFSAYSDMAIGLARMFGFRLAENFDKPYTSCSITEFWHRWHISLSTWIREYLYIPLGGNRVAPWRTYANLWVCFLASGLWHGAAWTYVAWGAYNGFFLVLERLFFKRWLDRMTRLAANAVTFLVTMVGWVIFRAASIDQAGQILRLMAEPGHPGTTATIWRTSPMLAAVGASALISFLPRLTGFNDVSVRTMAHPFGRLLVVSTLTLLFVLALAKALADPFRPFLYFRF